MSDILHNCTVKSVKNVSFYRTGFQVRFYLSKVNLIAYIIYYFCIETTTMKMKNSNPLYWLTQRFHFLQGFENVS